MWPISVLKVRDRSMEPSLNDGDFVLSSSLHRALESGDVVVFRKSGMLMVKRIANITDAGYFVVGDNPGASSDSRAFGSIHAKDIIGKVVARF